MTNPRALHMQCNTILCQMSGLVIKISPPPAAVSTARISLGFLETEFTNDEVSVSTYPSDLWHCSWALTETNGQTMAVGTAASTAGSAATAA